MGNKFNEVIDGSKLDVLRCGGFSAGWI